MRCNPLFAPQNEVNICHKKVSNLCLFDCLNVFICTDRACEEQIQKLNNDVSDLTKEKVRMLQLLEEKDMQFVELESHALSQEKKYLNELKVRKLVE